MYNNGNNLNVEPAKVAKGIVWAVAGIVLVIVSMAFIRPWYNVWSQEMEGKAEFAKAEQNRKIKNRRSKSQPRGRETQRTGRSRKGKRSSRGNPNRERQHHPHLYTIPVGAPAVGPQRQNRNLCAHRNQFAHTRVDTSAENARIISVGQTCRQVSAASIARLRLRRRRYCCKP